MTSKGFLGPQGFPSPDEHHRLVDVEYNPQPTNEGNEPAGRQHTSIVPPAFFNLSLKAKFGGAIDLSKRAPAIRNNPLIRRMPVVGGFLNLGSMLCQTVEWGVNNLGKPPGENTGVRTLGNLFDDEQHFVYGMKQGSLIFKILVSEEDRLIDIVKNVNNGELLKLWQEQISAHGFCDESEQITSLEILDIYRVNATREQVAEIKRECENALRQELDFSLAEIVLSNNPLLSKPGKDIPLLKNVQQGGVEMAAPKKVRKDFAICSDADFGITSSPINQPTKAKVTDDVRKPGIFENAEYDMNHKNRGKALIINNEEFDTTLLARRFGSKLDTDRLHKIFTILGFDVTIEENLSANQIMQTTKQFSEQDHSDSDAVAMAVFTHGDSGGMIWGTDKLVKINDIVDHFKAIESLAFKPKIFMFEACRCPDVESPEEEHGTDAAIPTSTSGARPWEAMVAGEATHLTADFLLCYSTTEGSVSWRHDQHGCWYIQELKKVMDLLDSPERQGSAPVDFLDVLTAVNRNVAARIPDTSRGNYRDKKQVSCFLSTLTKKLFLMPRTGAGSNSNAGVGYRANKREENQRFLALEKRVEELEHKLKKVERRNEKQIHHTVHHNNYYSSA